MAELSEKEAKIYDRQIRLWGVDAQKRMSSSRVLISGMKAFSAEICKNIVLAGIGSVTIMDHEVATSADLSGQFLIPHECLGKNRAEASLERLQALNPLVKVTCDPSDVSTKDPSFFDAFDLVCIVGAAQQVQVRVNDICREKGIMFMCGDSFGMMAYLFVDLGKEFKFTETKKGEDGNEYQKESTVSYVPMGEVLSAKWSSESHLSKSFLSVLVLEKYRRDTGALPEDEDKFITFKNEFLTSVSLPQKALPDDFARAAVRNANATLCPVAAVMGGFAGQEIITVVSRKHAPLDNFLVFDGLEMYAALIERIRP